MNIKLSEEEFLAKANLIINVDHSLAKYENRNSYLDLKCKLHNHSYKQLAHSFLSGKHGCKVCEYIKMQKTIIDRKTKNFLTKGALKHNNFYNYDKVNYQKAKEHVIITCPIHGDFLQSPTNHLSGYGCKKCADIKSSSSSRLTNNDFIEKSKAIHGDKYGYSEVDYTRSADLVPITCPEHGVFLKAPNHHLSKKQGCPKCNPKGSSKVEKEVLKFISEFIKCKPSDRTVLKGRELDIYVPSKKLAIEFHGLYWHSEKFRDKNYHLNKLNDCNEKGIRLVQIFEDEWEFKQDIVKSRLLNLIGVTKNRLHARKCKVKIVSTKEAINFLEENHIQGKLGAKIKLGLFFNKELVSLMTFGSYRKNLGSKKTENEFELLRFCNKLNFTVVGGASKLFTYFLKTFTPKKIISYADRRWSEGNLYKQLGFKEVNTSLPGYFYIKGNQRENRFKYRKSELVKNGHSENLTEKEIMSSLNIFRIYDCGTKKYEYKTDK